MEIQLTEFEIRVNIYEKIDTFVQIYDQFCLSGKGKPKDIED
jgi:hypothetical protein